MRVFVPMAAAFLVVSCLPGASHSTSRPVRDAIAAASVETTAAAFEADAPAKIAQKSPQNREFPSKGLPRGIDPASIAEFDTVGSLTADGSSTLTGTVDLNWLGNTNANTTPTVGAPVSGTFTANANGAFTGGWTSQAVRYSTPGAAVARRTRSVIT